MEVLHARTVLKIDAGSSQGGDAGHDRRHVVAQKLPLLTISVGLPVTGLRTCGPGIDGADTVRMSVWKISQKKSVDDGKYRRVRANGKRQGEEHRKRVPRTSPELANGKLEKTIQAFHPVTPSLLCDQGYALDGQMARTVS